MGVTQDDSRPVLRKRAARPPARLVFEVPPTPHVEVDVSNLELTARGLSFVDRDTEREYNEWYRDRSLPAGRTSATAALALWFVYLVAVLVVLDGSMRMWSSIGVVVNIAFFTFPGWVAAHIPRFQRWMMPMHVASNMASGVLGVLNGFWIFHRPDAALVAAIMVVYFAFTIQPLGIRRALVTVMPTVLLQQVIATQWLLDGRMDRLAFAVATIGIVNVLLSAVMVGVTGERGSRQTYRQERVIALQREALDRERERANVAERARDLSEALSRLGRAPLTTSSFALGDVVDGRYQIVRTLGRGGMGQVYEVERLADHARLALKVMTSVADRSALARFAREAQIAAELHHPNVVAALDVGVTEAGTLFLVMELVSGSSLATSRTRFGDVAWALPILRGIAEALAVMHERGIVHRDLKPANILLGDDNVKVADFGLASLRAKDAAPVTADDDTVAAQDLTQTGAVMGTPMYMAPELADGADDPEPSADIFSFGVVAYELIANRQPYAVAPVHERMNGRTAPDPQPLRSIRPELPATLGSLVDSCLRPAAERPPARSITAQLAHLSDL